MTETRKFAEKIQSMLSDSVKERGLSKPILSEADQWAFYKMSYPNGPGGDIDYGWCDRIRKEKKIPFGYEEEIDIVGNADCMETIYYKDTGGFVYKMSLFYDIVQGDIRFGMHRLDSLDDYFYIYSDGICMEGEIESEGFDEEKALNFAQDFFDEKIPMIMSINEAIREMIEDVKSSLMR